MGVFPGSATPPSYAHMDSHRAAKFGMVTRGVIFLWVNRALHPKHSPILWVPPTCAYTR